MYKDSSLQSVRLIERQVSLKIKAIILIIKLEVLVLSSISLSFKKPSSLSSKIQGSSLTVQGGSGNLPALPQGAAPAARTTGPSP